MVAVLLEEPPISHLLFADDAFLFCRASIDEYRVLKDVLTTYERASGQAINFGKSGYMCSNNVAADLQVGISYILGVLNPLNIGCYL